jgi:hypothetical protein
LVFTPHDFKDYKMKNLIVILALVMFSTAALAQDATSTSEDGAAASSTATNSASNGGQSVNIGCLVNCNEGEGERGVEGPTQSQADIHYSGEYDVNTVPNVSAPGLTTTLTETCMGSTSAGAGWVGFGFSFGTTWRDSACVRRLDARQLSAIGYNLGAKELMCDSDAVRQALKRAGKPCFVDLPAEVREEVNPAAAADVVEAEQISSGDAGGAGAGGAGAGVASKW